MIFKKGRGDLLFPPNCAPVSVARYVSISLNMPQYPSKYLNKLFSLCQGFEYTQSFCIFDRFFEDALDSKYARILNMAWLCICKGYVESQICLIMVADPSIMPEYASIGLNAPYYA